MIPAPGPGAGVKGWSQNWVIFVFYLYNVKIGALTPFLFISIDELKIAILT